MSVPRKGLAGVGCVLLIAGAPSAWADAIDYIHISKSMELGKGIWGDKVEDLNGLRDRFFHHMRNYDEIFTLRRLKDTAFHIYELVEIPKSLLLEAADGKMEMMHRSNQYPKPGYCTITDSYGRVEYQLYFNGGSERKLQVKALDKRLCVVHATWRFPKAESEFLFQSSES